MKTINNSVSMTDEQANAMVRDKLNRAQKWWGPKLMDYYERKCTYAKRGTVCTFQPNCGICPKLELVSFTIGSKIELRSQEYEIRITDRNGVNVYKMDDETWNLAYHIRRVLNEKEYHRSCVKDDLYWSLVGFGPWVAILGALLGGGYYESRLADKKQTDKQEKVIQAQKVVDSIDTAKTVYYHDSLNSIVKQ